MKDEYTFKIIIIGDTNVGKTQILNAYTDEFKEKSETTIGIDFKIKKIDKKEYSVIFQIWDTAGEERYKSVVSQYYKKTSGAFIVYDITNRKSFENIDEWLKKIQENTEIILLGNKQDLKERKIQYEEGESKADQYKMGFYEVSAKTKKNINEAFSSLFNNVIKKHKNTYTNDIEIEHNRSCESLECC